MAVSGKGVNHNSFGVPGPKIPTLYTRVTDNSKPYSYKYQDGVKPDAIFFFIGANDYSHPIKPNKANFVSGYKKMLEVALEELLYVFPESKPIFITICALEISKKMCENIKQAT